MSSLECPTCGWTCNATDGVYIDVGDETLDGDYCKKCWADHIALTIPKMAEAE